MLLRATTIVLVATLEVACTRAVPVRAPAIIVVETVRGGSLFTSGDVAEGSGPAWQVRDEVEVEWQGGWFPAVVLEKRGTRLLVHYEGYGNDWDELVAADRVRERRAAPAADEVETSDDGSSP
jgi:hypothetical protein